MARNHLPPAGGNQHCPGQGIGGTPRRSWGRGGRGGGEGEQEEEREEEEEDEVAEAEAEVVVEVVEIVVQGGRRRLFAVVLVLSIFFFVETSV